jgi:iron complex transport system ATP-binding protein
MIEIRDITLAYGDRVVLKDFSAQVRPATIAAIVGSNGAGKSTLISAIAGELAPIAGEILVAAKDLALSNLKDLAQIRSVGQQSHSYWMAYSVQDILRLGNEAVAPERFNFVVEQLALNEFLEQSVTALSGGQLQRVEIARAFMREVPLVLLDEPLASQDLISQAALIEFFKAERAIGRTILLVAHREKSSLAWCDQIIDLSQ